MKPQEFVGPFGSISVHKHSATYTATSDWQLLSEHWKIRMYRTLPGSQESVELSSSILLATDLFQPLNDLYDELEGWERLSDEALLDFEASVE